MRTTYVCSRKKGWMRHCAVMGAVIVLLALIFIAVAVFTGGVSGSSQSQAEQTKMDAQAVQGTPEGFDDTFAQCKPGEFAYRINTNLKFENTDSPAYLLAQNMKTNALSMQVVIRLEEGKVLCQTEMVPPGYYVTFVSLGQSLEAGEYFATADIVLYDSDELTQQGVLQQQVVVTVMA